MFDIFRSLPAALDDLPENPEIRQALVFAAWERIAGSDVAERTCPTGLRDATLLVAAENLVWRRQLEDLAPQLIFKLNSALGAGVVRFIEFSVDQKLVQHSRRRDESAEPDDQTALAALPVEILMAAEKIEDTGMRRLFLLAAGKCILSDRAEGFL